jgi:predicted lactoylglutathione lyase
MYIHIYLCVDTNGISENTYNEVGYNVDSNPSINNSAHMVMHLCTYVLL